MRWCWVNFQCRGVLLILIKVGQGPTALTVGEGGGYLDIFTLVYHFSFLSPSLWETTQYRLKYCLKGSLSPKQPTNRMQLPKKDCYSTMESNIWEIEVAPLVTKVAFVIHREKECYGTKY